MIIVTFLAGFSFLPRVLRVGGFPPAPVMVSIASPDLKQAAPGRKLPLRGRIWGTFIPPWPNYGRTRRGTPPTHPDDRRNRNS
jgi:hypothetical protein